MTAADQSDQSVENHLPRGRPHMADAVEASGQHVQEKAPDELVRVKPHRLPASRPVDAIVLPAERDAGVVGCNEAAVRDGDTVVGMSR
jgi:hypothetical protein